jgi:hypothetical protein
MLRALGESRDPGYRLQSNRWVGRVKNDRAGWAGEKGAQISVTAE